MTLVGDEALEELALTVLQLHAGYEQFRAELVRTAERGMPGPAEWIGFYSDEQPMYPTFIHHVGRTKVTP